MILQSLNDLYSRLAEEPAYKIAPPGFSPQKISFCIRIRPDGSLVQIEDARIRDKNGELQSKLMRVPGEAKPSGSGINPGLLWDNQTYLLGRQPDNKPAGFGRKRFFAFRKRHLELEAMVRDPTFSAVCRFLERWHRSRLAEHPILNEISSGFGVLALQGEKCMAHESKRVQEWWRSTLEHEADEDTYTAQCLITGKNAPIARLQPRIKGVAGAKTVGASLVSFNASAYESFGKTQSFNAPVSVEAAFRYGTALNSLLNGPQSAKHRLRIGDTTTVFWTENRTLIEDCLADIFGSGSRVVEETQDIDQRERIKRLLEAIRSGSRYQDLGGSDTPFHILGLAPNAARLSIRFYHRSTIANLIEKLHDHQQCMEIVRQFTTQVGARPPDPEFPAIWQILRETARVADEIPPLLSGAVARSIVEGVPYPEGLFSAIIRRIQADRNISYLRAATLKAVFVRNHKLSIPIMLDPTNTDPAYLLGRLFSALEKTQEDALGNINAGIRDRFYGSASATPASVFPRLLQTYPHHLSGLNGGAKVNRERLIQEILSPIQPTGFPNHLSMKMQGVFAIGYYHQRKDFFTKKDVSDQPT